MTKRVAFTQEMRAQYTILMPTMLPIHFSMVSEIFKAYGYRTVLLENEGQGVIDMGLKYVHNDACYPVQLVAGQFLDALLSGKYDVHKTAVMITQTGGGCRASNYVAMIRKALARAGLEFVPVVSLNFAKIEKNPGFVITTPMLHRALYAVIVGDLLMLLRDQCRPYEVNAGDTDRAVAKWADRVGKIVSSRSPFFFAGVHRCYKKIVRDFEQIERAGARKPRVGIVGEIFIKFSSLGNNRLEDFLVREGAETYTPGLLNFGLYCLDNIVVNRELYRMSAPKALLSRLGIRLADAMLGRIARVVRKNSRFDPPMPFSGVRGLVKGYIGDGVKMGEGWLLPAEILEMIHAGIPNVVCVQPFGCLPNHIVGKGVMKPIQERNPDANIVAIDYDPGMTKVNQENRLRLMLANAR